MKKSYIFQRPGKTAEKQPVSLQGMHQMPRLAPFKRLPGLCRKQHHILSSPSAKSGLGCQGHRSNFMVTGVIRADYLH